MSTECFTSCCCFFLRRARILEQNIWKMVWVLVSSLLYLYIHEIIVSFHILHPIHTPTNKQLTTFSQIWNFDQQPQRCNSLRCSTGFPWSGWLEVFRHLNKVDWLIDWLIDWLVDWLNFSVNPETWYCTSCFSFRVLSFSIFLYSFLVCRDHFAQLL